MSDSGAIRRGLDDLPTRFAMASNLAQQGDVEGAERAFAAIVTDHPNCHEAHYMRGRLCLAGQRLDEAKLHLERAEALDPGNPEYLLRLGQVALAQRDDTTAISCFERARDEVEEESPELAAAYAAALALGRQFHRAAQAYERACALAPGDTSLWIARASMQQRRGDVDGAEASLRQAIELDPDDPVTRGELALKLEHANRVESARAVVEAALARCPTNARALIARARLARRTRDHAGARRDLEAALEHADDQETKRQALFTLANVLDALGAFEEAVSLLSLHQRSRSELGASQRGLGEAFLQSIAAHGREITTNVVSSWQTAPPSDRPSPVFFVGFPRSGTTLLEQMLAAHPRFVTTDEDPAMFTVQHHLMRSVGPAGTPAALGQLKNEQIVQLRGVYWSELEATLGPIEAGVRVVDKSPLGTANLATAHRLFPESPVIMSLRDPRDVCVSCVFNLSRSPMGASLLSDFDTAAQSYAQVMALWLHYRNELGLRFIETRYEDVIRDPEGEIRRVLGFLGEPWDDAVLQFRERAQQRSIRTASYEQVTQKLYGTSIGRWRHYERFMGSALETLAPFVNALGYD